MSVLNIWGYKEVGKEFKAGPFEKKSITLKRYLVWHTGNRNSGIYDSFGDDASLQQMLSAMQSTYQLCEKFKNSKHTFICSKPTPEDLLKCGVADFRPPHKRQWMDSLVIQVSQEWAYHPASIENGVLTFQISLPQAAEMIRALQKGLKHPNGPWPTLISISDPADEKEGSSLHLWPIIEGYD
jgi:hypothetical protein